MCIECMHTHAGVWTGTSLNNMYDIFCDNNESVCTHNVLSDEQPENTLSPTIKVPLFQIIGIVLRRHSRIKSMEKQHTII
jgi:hypothetical protein